MYIDYHHLHFADHKYAVLIRLTSIYISISNVYGTSPRTWNIFRPTDVFLKMYKGYDEEHRERRWQKRRRNIHWFRTWVPGMMSVEWISCNAWHVDGSYTKIPHSWKDKNLRSSSVATACKISILIQDTKIKY